jgi:TctA family transporter
MDLGWLISYFLNPGPQLIATLVQVGLGLVLGAFIKRLIIPAIGVFLVLLSAYLVGVLTLPEQVLTEVQTLLGDAGGRLASALILLSPFAVGLILGAVIGVVLL